MLYICSACQGGYASAGEAPPEPCPLCGKDPHWWPFVVTEFDRRFLKSFRIEGTVPAGREAT
jgi:hypothetical protein